MGWLSGWSWRKGVNVSQSPGAGAGYVVRVEAFANAIAGDAFYQLSPSTAAIAADPTLRHSFEPCHSTNIVACNATVDGASRAYLAYDCDQAGSQIRLYYCDLLDGQWTAYSGNPILGVSANHYRWPSVAKVGGTYHMFCEDVTASKLQRFTSADGITFSLAETVVTGAGYGNPFIWLNPQDGLWYLYSAVVSGTTYSVVVRSAAAITDLAAATPVTILTHESVPTDRYLGAASVFYRDGFYWMATESNVNSAYWITKIWSSTLPTSGFTLCTDSPKWPDDQACTKILVGPDGAKGYVYTVRGSTTWYADAYQILFDRVGLQGNARADFGDVRFTASDSTTLLPHWMESSASGDRAVFWVRVSDNLTSGSAIIYLYYGKADATSVSSGANTFSFFDDFTAADGANVDWTKWQSTDHTVYTIASNQLRAALPSASTKILNTAAALVGGFMVRARMRASVTNTAARFTLEPAAAAYTGKDAGFLKWDTDAIYCVMNNLSKFVSYAEDLGSYFHFDGFIPASGVGTMRSSVAGKPINSQRQTPTATTLYPSFLSSFTSGVTLVDYVFARPWVAWEPTVGVWGGQANAPHGWCSFSGGGTF